MSQQSQAHLRKKGRIPLVTFLVSMLAGGFWLLFFTPFGDRFKELDAIKNDQPSVPIATNLTGVIIKPIPTLSPAPKLTLNNSMSTLLESTVSSPPHGDSEALKAWLDKESSRMGQTVQSPDQMRQMMKERARELQDEDLKVLSEEAQDSKAQMDSRLFSVEMLGLNGTNQALQYLEKAALSQAGPEDGKPLAASDMRAQEQRVLRAQAVENLSLNPQNRELAQTHLQNILNKTKDSFLSDRANRSLWYLQGRGPSPEEQDKEALKQVLKKHP